MALSKEFYLDEIRSKYPNSYNESLKDLPIKDLEDMLDFLEGALEKADGGSIGIEVFFGPKRGEYQTGGQAYDPRASIQDYAAALQKVGGGTNLQKTMDIQRYGQNVRGPSFNLFSGPAFDKYSAERTRAYQSPTRLQYNLDANKAAGQFIQDRTKELLGDNPISRTIGGLGSFAAVPVAALATPFHEAAQVVKEGRMEPGSGIKGFTEAFLKEKPLLTAAQRAGGVLQSVPGVGDAVTKAGEKAFDLVQGAKDLFKPTEAAAAEAATPTPDAATSGKFMLYSDPPGTPGRKAIGMVDPNDSKHYGGYDAQGRERFHNPSSDEYDPFSNLKKGSYGDPNYQRPTMADVAGPTTPTPDSPDLTQYSNIPELTRLMNDNPNIRSLAEADDYLKDKERFRLGLFAAQEIDAKTGDRLYDIDKMYSDYLQAPGRGYFSSQDMYDRFKQFYADGGRVGLFMGGPALEGQALQIYNSMKGYNFSDQEIADALSARGLYNKSESTIGGIVQPLKGTINKVFREVSGEDIPTRPTSEIVTDFQETITDRQNKLNNPGKIASFVGDFIPQQRSIADMLASGQVDTRLTGGIPLGVGSMIAKALPDKYYDMSLADQITTQAYMGFTDPNTNMANKDPFGLNVRSAFGNYAEKAAEIVDTLEAKLAKNGFLSNYDQSRLGHYRNVTKTKQDAVADLGLINLAKEQAEAKRQEALKKIQAQGKMDYNPNIHGPVNYGKDSQGNQSFDSGMGFGIGSDGGPVSNRTGRGRTGFSEGGLATMFTRRR